MKRKKIFLLTLLIIGTMLWAKNCMPLEFPWSDHYKWYYKKADKYKGWKYIVIHHSATQAGSVKAFHTFHTQQGYGGIAYHFVIGNGHGMPDGAVQATFRWKKQIAGTHVSGNAWNHNVFGIGICLVGNLEKSPPTKAQIASLLKLIDMLKQTYDITANNIVGHKHVKSSNTSGRTEKTACPGKKLDIAKVRDLSNHYHAAAKK